MGVSGSSLLDEKQAAFIRGEAEAELHRFSPFFQSQFSEARFLQAQSEVEQKQEPRRRLSQKAPSAGGEVLYEDALFYFDETRKWRERYVVMRASYSLELYEGLETYINRDGPLYRLLPTGGAVFTTEESYMKLVDLSYPDASSVKEDFGPPGASLPGPFPVYLRLPYRRDSYFCFKQQQRQEAFLSVLRESIRHQNIDFLQQNSCEVKSFIKAVQFYRESEGHYESWEKMQGSDVRVLSNVVMVRLLPTLEKDLLPKLKTRKNEKKRLWFATVEEVYILIQKVLLDGLSSLKEEMKNSLRQKDVMIHSDMDHIRTSRDQLEQRVRGLVSGPLEVLVSEKVQPHLPSVLDHVMGPISRGFRLGRDVCEETMERAAQDVMKSDAKVSLSCPSLEDSYKTMASLQDNLHLRETFGFKDESGIVHRAQIQLQQLMENALHTFEILLKKTLEETEEDTVPNLDKAQHRVLRNFDYDSSSVRKRICEDALLRVTLPFIKHQLQETRTQIPDLSDLVLPEHSDFVQIENVYEDVLQSVLQSEVSRVLKEADTLQKHHLFSDSRDLLSSAPSSPASSLASSLGVFSQETTPITETTTTTETMAPMETTRITETTPTTETTPLIETTPSKETTPTTETTPLIETTPSKETTAITETVALTETTPTTQATPPKGTTPTTETTPTTDTAPTKETPPTTETTPLIEIKPITESSGATQIVDAGGDKLDAGGDKMDASGDKMDVGGDKMDASGDKMDAGGDKMDAGGDKMDAGGDKMDAGGDKMDVGGDKMDAGGDKMDAGGDKMDLGGDKMDVGGDKMDAGGDKMDAGGDKMDAGGDKIDAGEDKMDIEVESNSNPQSGANARLEAQVEEEVTDVLEETGSETQVKSAENKMEEHAAETKVTETSHHVTDPTAKQEPNAESRLQDKMVENIMAEVVAAAPSGGDGDSNEEGSTTSDILEENSQSQLSSEEEADQSERSRAEPESEKQRHLQAQEEQQQEKEQEQQEKEQEQQEKEEEQQEQQQEEDLSVDRPMGCIREIRDLVQEVIEVEDLVQRFPEGVPLNQD